MSITKWLRKGGRRSDQSGGDLGRSPLSVVRERHINRVASTNSNVQYKQINVSSAAFISDVMSLDSLRIRNADDTNLGEALKIWSCINCRRRKVRCDRRDPCAPCIRNNADCVFPVSGRLPRRGRDTKYPHQKQAELLGRLRRLEAMVGDLGSEVENAASLGSQSVDNPLNAFITRSDWSGDQQSAPPSRSASGDHFSKKDGVQASSDVGKNTSGLLQESQESEGWLAAGNGEFVVKDRFWTGFCKEV